MPIWTRTQARYERTDRNKPMPPYGSVKLPVCLNCGSYAIPLTHNHAHCPTDGNVSFVMVPENLVDEVREVIENTPQADGGPRQENFGESIATG